MTAALRMRGYRPGHLPARILPDVSPHAVEMCPNKSPMETE